MEVEERKIIREIVGFVTKILVKEGNIVAALCALWINLLLLEEPPRYEFWDFFFFW